MISLDPFVPELLLAGPVFLASTLGTLAVRRYALRHLLDQPNERSSHTQPVPRGGGAAVVAAFLTGVVALWLMQTLPTALMGSFVLGGGAIAAIGFLDDHRPIPARIRFLVHVAAAVLAVAVIGPIQQVQFGATWVTLPYALAMLLSVLGVVWLINLYNFMDGIDGIAAGQAVVAGTAAALIFGFGATPVHGALLLAAASLGFLLHNWSPARIFMGDVGSGFLGYALGVLLLASAQPPSAHAGAATWIWLLLLGPFWIDATVTLVRRLLQGKRWYVAHRSHAYQHLARRLHSHARATSCYVIAALALSAVAAWVSALPSIGWLLVLFASVPLIACAAALDAGVDASD